MRTYLSRGGYQLRRRGLPSSGPSGPLLPRAGEGAVAAVGGRGYKRPLDKARYASPLPLAGEGWRGRATALQYNRSLLLRLPDQSCFEADFRRLLREDRGEPAGIGHERGLEGIAARLHFLPRAFLAQLDRRIGDERQRQDGRLRHVLAFERFDRELQRQGAGIGRRSVGD